MIKQVIFKKTNSFNAKPIVLNFDKNSIPSTTPLKLCIFSFPLEDISNCSCLSKSSIVNLKKVTFPKTKSIFSQFQK